MLKRMFLGMLSVALTLGVTMAPAQAGDERPCVTQQEYRDVQTGWRQARVADHFDTPGRAIGYEDGWERGINSVWMYRKCSAWGPGGWYVGVGYGNQHTGYGDRYMRVWGKAPISPWQLLLTHMRDLGVPPVQPDGGRPCVTQQEYRDVNVGRWSWWSQVRVMNHFDTRGELVQLWGFSDEYDTWWRYRKCSAWGPGGWYVGVHFNNWDYEGDFEFGPDRKDPKLTMSELGLQVPR
jgi:hypothetical protein